VRTGSVGRVGAADSGRELVERVLGRPVAGAARAAWGFTNRTDMVTLADGRHVAVQRYRRREDAAYRLRVMRGLSGPAAEAGIPLPRVLEFSLADDDTWVIYDVLPGVPVPEAGELAPGGTRFPHMAGLMGELLAAFRRLPATGLGLEDLWAEPRRLAAAAAHWAGQLSLPAAGRVAGAVPALFAGRPVVLAHGDFAPVNVLTDGTAVTGLLDFEATRLADPLFDPAWWAWSVSFSGPGVLDAAWPAFLAGAGIDPAEPGLAERVRVLQVLRMMEQLAAGALPPGVAGIVADRLRATLT
jgi:aminoglycoside phosphotransferase (APT) family kinase protein